MRAAVDVEGVPGVVVRLRWASRMSTHVPLKGPTFGWGFLQLSPNGTLRGPCLSNMGPVENQFELRLL